MMCFDEELKERTQRFKEEKLNEKRM